MFEIIVPIALSGDITSQALLSWTVCSSRYTWVTGVDPNSDKVFIINSAVFAPEPQQQRASTISDRGEYHLPILRLRPWQIIRRTICNVQLPEMGHLTQQSPEGGAWDIEIHQPEVDQTREAEMVHNRQVPPSSQVLDISFERNLTKTVVRLSQDHRQYCGRVIATTSSHVIVPSYIVALIIFGPIPFQWA